MLKDHDYIEKVIECLCVMVAEASSDDIIKWLVNAENSSWKPT